MAIRSIYLFYSVYFEEHEEEEPFVAFRTKSALDGRALFVFRSAGGFDRTSRRPAALSRPKESPGVSRCAPARAELFTEPRAFVNFSAN